MGRGRKAQRRLPRAVKQALQQQNKPAPTEDLSPLERRNPALVEPPRVRKTPVLLPASTSNEPEALVHAPRPQTDALLQQMGQSVYVGQQIEGACEFWIELKEEILGGLQIRISLAKGRVSASLLVQSEDTKALITKKLPQLKQQLRLRGMTINTIEVLVPSSAHSR
jgi:flagellar hook-length control protein FliK